ncbi:hypothetical protein [Thauera propionica]|uniref:hypothetical protein n=1 Tax=Thauera propionica TaxID=2019431 RepID=UPI0023F0DA53|nr:hypothetical protein [Thauera propionica]MDD3676521.1 hypothetical protein [Thauera propionica]
MTGVRGVVGTVESTNAIRLDSPYDKSPVTATLGVYVSKAKTHLVLRLSDGQIECGVSGCSVLVRFDDRPALSFPAEMPEGFFPAAISIQNTLAFVDEITSAKKLRVSVPVYRGGDNIFRFDVDGFDAVRKRADEVNVRQSQ